MAQASDRSFAYRASLSGGEQITGTLNAADMDAARRLLESLRLQVVQLWPAGPAARAAPLSVQDLKTFNQQLAMLIKSGLPVEAGLRLLGSEMDRGRLARATNALTSDLESGLSLPQAIEKNKDRFPADYAPLVQAGIQSNNLAGVLLNLSSHLELSAKLRDALRRALYYPFFVFIAILLVLSFLGLFVLPQFREMYGTIARGGPHYFSFHLPFATQILLTLGRRTPQILTVLIVLIVAAAIFWLTFQHRRLMLHLRDMVAQRVALLGPAVRNQLIARWINGLRIGVDAGMDLPAAIELAGAISGSPAVQADCRQMMANLSAGRALDKTPPCRILPKTIPAALQLAIQHNNLSDTLATLAESFRRQAEHRIAVIPAALSPALLVLLALTVGYVIYAMVAPLIAMLHGLTSAVY